MEFIERYIIRHLEKDLVLSSFLDEKSLYRSFNIDIYLFFHFICIIPLLNHYLDDNSIFGLKTPFILMLIILNFVLIFFKKECLNYDLSLRSDLDEEFTILDYFNIVAAKFIDNVLPNKSYRFSSFHSKAYKTILNTKKEHELVYLDYEKTFLNKGIKEFLVENFNRKEKSLVRFYQERIRDSYGVVQDNFIFYSMIIPKRRNMNLDKYKTILKNNQFPPDLIYAPLGFSFEDLIDNKKINNAFVLYSEDDIVKLFTKYYNFEQLISIISMIAETDIKIPVMKSIEEIYFYLLKTERMIKDGSFKLNQLENNKLHKIQDLEYNIGNNKYKFYILKDMEDMYNWGKALKNCLNDDDMDYKNKIIKKQFNLIGIIKNNKKYAVMSIIPNKKRYIRELKKKANQSLDPIEEAVIKTNFIKYYK